MRNVKMLASVICLVLLIASYFLAGFLLCSPVDSSYAQDAPLPMNAPIIQVKTIHTLTADERSEIVIKDVWKQLDIGSVEIGEGASLGLIRVSPPSSLPVEPCGWQAFINQKVLGSWRGSYEAVAYGGL